ncbi:MAG TPA: CHAT domain-containing protein [Blastocatellia bacterium]|nr:CHAT domain-containing protein [Blastocatellia bacterium]
MRNATRNRCPLRMLSSIIAISISLLFNFHTVTAATVLYKQSKSDKLNEAKRLAAESDRLYKQGRYDEAIPLVERWLAIVENVLGPEDQNVATALNNLAYLYEEKGDYTKAEPLFQRALAIREKALGPQHPDVATDLDSLAVLYYYKGDYTKAELLYQRALAIREKTLGQKNPLVASTLNNLAELYQTKGDLVKAESFFQRALQISEKSLGPQHPEVATSLNNLGLLYVERSDYAKAEPLYQRALAIREKTLGPEHSDVARLLNNLAELYRAKGGYTKAEPLFQRSLQIKEKSLGPEHPDIATTLNNLAALYEAQNITAKAIARRTQATNISEHNIVLNLAIGSERQKLLFLDGYSRETNDVISLHIRSAPSDQSALRLALTTVLRRKGRALDAMAESIAALRRRLNPEQQTLLDRLTAERAKLASLTLAGPNKKGAAQYKADIKSLEEGIETLEDQVSRQSAQYRVQSQPVTLETVQAAIPADAMLIEFISFYPYNVKQSRWEPRRYAAFALGNRGQPASVDLGAASEIDKLVNELRAVLREGEGKPMSVIERDVKPKARALDQKIMQPVRKLIGDKRKLLLSPDGTLNLIPFAALVDEKGKYLIESYSLTYLTTGRDLLRLQARMENKQGAVVFANPDFGVQQKESEKKTTKGNNAEQEKARTVINFSQAYFPALPGTAEEAQELKAIFPDAKVWTQRQATKTALKQLNAPLVLHIATHGFFLDDVIVSAAEAKSRGLFIRTNQPGEVSAPEIHIENPLLRSGLAFTGANLRRSGEDDGILTAMEASGLNLWGTKLVVLSACDTGVGEIKNGEGVYGLRRALVLAGSETQVMSLWPVSDEGTRDLMIEYYKALKAGQGRSEALRQVQLKMLSSKNRNHPYYWASFIQSGEWANLDGKR